jgi:hypothetical protein
MYWELSHTGFWTYMGLTTQIGLEAVRVEKDVHPCLRLRMNINISG